MRHAYELDGAEHEAWLARAASGAAGSPADGRWRIHAADGSAEVSLDMHGEHDGVLTVDGRAVPVVVARHGDRLHLHLDGRSWTLRHRHPLDRAAAEAHGHADDESRAPMPGTAVSVAVRPGDAVRRGTPLLVMESMKLETTIAAARDGIVAEVNVTPGQAFDRDALLVTLVPLQESGA